MRNRSIKKIYPAYKNDIHDLKTVTPIPSPEVDYIDPFLFLNHHGPQVYKTNNQGLPFGPHPHRGFQTVTFILEGDIAHKDSAGHESVIGPGGVQWMSAGRGLIHEEVSSEAFKKNGGPLEILQLWINLPAKFKMSEPYYKGLQRNEIFEKDGIQYISGENGAFKPSTDITVLTIELEEQTSRTIKVPEKNNIFFYVVRGTVEVNEQIIAKMNLVDFNNDGDAVTIRATEKSLVLFCHAEPYNEPVASHGPFVMNTREEIIQAFEDYQNGRI